MNNSISDYLPSVRHDGKAPHVDSPLNASPHLPHESVMGILKGYVKLLSTSFTVMSSAQVTGVVESNHEHLMEIFHYSSISMGNKLEKKKKTQTPIIFSHIELDLFDSSPFLCVLYQLFCCV